jgi:RHS repeat-associated protein
LTPDGYEEEVNGSTTTRRVTYAIAGQTVALRVQVVGGSNTLYYLHSDHLGSTSLATTTSGAVVSGSTSRHHPFGSFRTTPTAGLTDVGFTGHRHNNLGANDLGLVYMGARFYLPGVGRFLSADTIVPDPMNPQQFNRYSYVLNNALRYTDPSGRYCYDPSAGDLYGTCVNDDGTTYSLVPSHRDQAMSFYRTRFVRPYAGTRSLTSTFGPDHPDGVDWGGQFTALAPADGRVIYAGADSTAGIWRIRNISTGQIREWSPWSTATEENPHLYLRDRDGDGLVEPQRLLATGDWTDERPTWSHVPGTMVVIDHGRGIQTVYYHLTIDASIVVGAQVRQGDVLGETANIGRSSAVHLHYGVRYVPPNGIWEWINPIQ